MNNAPLSPSNGIRIRTKIQAPALSKFRSNSVGLVNREESKEKMNPQKLDRKTSVQVENMLFSDFNYHFKSKSGRMIVIKPLQSRDRDRNLYKYILHKNMRE